MVRQTDMSQTEAHLQSFERFSKESTQPAWIAPLRKAGIERFAAIGYPTLNDEDWYEDADGEKLEADIKKEWAKFIENDLPAINNVLSAQGWLSRPSESTT